MKKLLALSLGIIFLVAIVNVGGCKSADEDQPDPAFKKVTISINAATTEHGKSHLKMSDPLNNDVIDSLLHTNVKPGTTVIWQIKNSSGVKKIDSIYPTAGRGSIFQENPRKKFLSRKFELVVPQNVKPNMEEEYTISFTLKDGTPGSTDPYLRIPEIGTNSSQ